MNIFFLSVCPILAAQFVCDMHCSKMFVELMQVLSTVFSFYTSVDRTKALNLYRPTHKKHPIVLWAASSSANFEWCMRLGEAMSDEYIKRYGKSVRHASHAKLVIIQTHYHEISASFPKKIISLPPLCMHEKYRISYDPVESYRFYYRHAKASFAKWKNNTKMPEWWDNPHIPFNPKLVEEAGMERKERLDHEAVKRDNKRQRV
jgi:hypothetical protein